MKDKMQSLFENELKAKWFATMKDKMQSLFDSHTYEVMKLSNGKRLSRIG